MGVHNRIVMFRSILIATDSCTIIYSVLFVFSYTRTVLKDVQIIKEPLYLTLIKSSPENLCNLSLIQDLIKIHSYFLDV